MEQPALLVADIRWFCRKITYTDYARQAQAPLTHLQPADATIRADEAEFHALRPADLASRADEPGDQRGAVRAGAGRSGTQHAVPLTRAGTTVRRIAAAWIGSADPAGRADRAWSRFPPGRTMSLSRILLCRMRDGCVCLAEDHAESRSTNLVGRMMDGGSCPAMSSTSIRVISLPRAWTDW